jgi:hypothetical protein
LRKPIARIAKLSVQADTINEAASIFVAPDMAPPPHLLAQLFDLMEMS